MRWLLTEFHNTNFSLLSCFPTLATFGYHFYRELFPIPSQHRPLLPSLAMEQEQANSAPSGQNSAQNPPPTPSSSSTSPIEEDDIATNTNGNLHVEPEDEEEENHASIAATEKERITLPLLGGPSATTTASEDSVNPSPYTNLSRHAVTNEMVFGPIPDREYHEGFMRKAIEMAQLALDSDETPVGCVFVRDGEVIGRGINGTNASLNVSVEPFLFFSL